MKKAIILSMMLALVLTGCSVSATKAPKALTQDEAKAKITDFINNQLLAGAQYKATVNSISEENGLYKLSIDVNSQKIDAYMTRDASKFFPQVIEMKAPATEAETASSTPKTEQPQAVQSVNKKLAKPTVELFVMSACPYGTQIEKGILKAIATLKNKVAFTVKFCDYSMHGQPELNEQMNQYCIQKNEPQLFQAYLNCYLQAGDSAGCVKSTKVNSAKMTSCVAATDKAFGVTAGFNDKSTWVSGQYPQFNVFKDDNKKYGVQGSPTLVINGETISSGRDPQSLLKTICSGFVKAPAECSTTLSSTSPAPGFGSGSDTTGTDATCNTPAN